MIPESIKVNIVNNLTTTKLGYVRIKKNLKIENMKNNQVMKLIKKVINITPLSCIDVKGKNYYITSMRFNMLITINKRSLGVITIHRLK